MAQRLRPNLKDDPPSPEKYYAFVIPIVDRKATEVFPTLTYLFDGDSTPDDRTTNIYKNVNQGHNFKCLNEGSNSLGADPPTPQPQPQPQPQPTPTPPSPSGDHVITVTLWHVTKDDLEHDKDYPHFFSNSCKALCANETKYRLTQHFSLWEHYVNEIDKSKQQKTPPPPDPENEFVIIVEDDNTVLKPELLKPLIMAMKSQKIDIIQFGDTVTAPGLSPINLTLLVQNPPIYGYVGGIDFSLSAYIVRLSALYGIYKNIINTGGSSAGLSFEISKIESELNLTRYVVSNPSEILRHEPYYVIQKRLGGMSGCFWQKLGLWLSKWYPKLVYFSTTPIFSIMGLFDVNVVDIIILIYIAFLIIFYVRSPFLWFIAGLLLTAII
ncbi:imv p35 heparan binding surface protein [Pteropox virus]|uniref:Imv p35 heparan binding surface protein n=1 Tax=Pteropox virus TaxID=1873698 RepID=A0A1B1MRE8_9POXV|nr:imv p35 heparan binding surface protein [Pteropox virus]ANS71161.1 imv p35 heparan binding surface protein [Pteropox virus]